MNLLDGLRGRNRAAKCDQWVAFAIRGQQPGCQVAHARTRRGNCDASLTRQSSDAAGNERRILLVTADDGLNGGRNQGVKHLVDLRAGDSEDILNPVLFQRLHYYLSARLCSL